MRYIFCLSVHFFSFSFDDYKIIFSVKLLEYWQIRILTVTGTWGLFLKSPGPISGATIPFISSQCWGSKPSQIAILFVILTLKTC